MQEISPQELKNLLQQPESCQLIDVREPHEHEAFNIGGTLVPLSEILDHAGQIDKEKPVILYCKMGIRSHIAIQRLEDKFGFTNLINLKGGLHAWKQQFPPV